MEVKTREVVADLCGAMLCQSIVEKAILEASAPGDEGLVTITFKRISRHQLPRLVVDYGDVLHSLLFEIRRREQEEYDRQRADSQSS